MRQQMQGAIGTKNDVPVYDTRRNRRAATAVLKDANRWHGSKYIKKSYSGLGFHYN